MPPTQVDSNEFSYYVENLLFNHDIELLSQFVKDMSFEKKEDYATTNYQHKDSDAQKTNRSAK